MEARKFWAKKFEPKIREAREDVAFVGDRLGHDDIEGAMRSEATMRSERSPIHKRLAPFPGGGGTEGTIRKEQCSCGDCIAKVPRLLYIHCMR